jgi:glutathione synthase/RimK-type ligase-like ATP-grasp enzyme
VISTRTAPLIGIFSFRNDLHALAVQHELKTRHSVDCEIFETPGSAERNGLAWHEENGRQPNSWLRATSGRDVSPADLSLVWWRRINTPQVFEDETVDEISRRLTSNSWRNAIVGLLKCDFEGQWVNDPEMTTRAENKLVQLRAASKAGFRIPATLVSQDPPTVRDFCTRHGGTVVVKSVGAVKKRALITAEATLQDLQDDAEIAVAPTIFQEVIPGQEHLRIHCFGRSVHAVRITSQELDWRRNLNVPFEPFELDAAVADRVRAVLDLLGLKMGIVDVKFDAGEAVWLEVNPQGQFLFAEGLSGMDLLGPFAAFLVQEARPALHPEPA